MKIGLIGDEPAGPVLAKAWGNAGHQIVGAAVSTPEAIDRIEAMLPEVRIDSMPAVAEEAEVVLLAVPYEDASLVCEGLADLGLFGPRKIVIHLSPLNGYGALAAAALHNAVPIALHPVMPFTGTTMDLQVLKNSPIACSAPETFMPIAQALAIELGGEPFEISEEQRAAYAEAYDVATNFSSLVVQQAVGIMQEAEISNPARLIGPMVRTAIEEALHKPMPPLDPESFS
jgi:predicted short-subunit dehydrogenase-like oxidoreductase (DUF2520 family)